MRTVRTDVDHPWTLEDERAADALVQEWARRAPPAGPGLRAPARPLDAPRGIDPTSLLTIHVFSIGQADSMLVVGPAPQHRTLLVDLGEPTGGSTLPPGLGSSARYVLGRIEELTGRTHVDYFMATHYHSDHLGYGRDQNQGWGTGIIALLSDPDVAFSVGEFIHVGDDGAEFMKPERKRGVYKTVATRMDTWQTFRRVHNSAPPRFGDDQIDLGPGIKVDILAFAGRTPDGATAFQKARGAGADYSSTPGNENDLSIALEISGGEFELFTAGDLNGTDDPQRHPFYLRRNFGEIYTNVEHHLVDYWESAGRESDVEVYRADHHGSGFSNTSKLIDALDPEFILYSTGADHGHPDGAAVQRGARSARQLATSAVTDIAAFRAARGETVGEIEIRVAADGQNYTINGEPHRAYRDTEEAAGNDVGEEDRRP